MMFLVIGNNRLRHVHLRSAHQHAPGLVPARAEDRAADSQNAGQRPLVQRHRPVLHQPAEPVAKTDDLHVIHAERRLAHAANGRVQTGAIPARSKDADVLFMFHK